MVVGDGMVVKAGHMNQGDLQTGVTAGGVRALIVAMKPGNAGGAKGRRKVDA
jgi:acetyltransferase-like isoleucine patch superfamily enzyme